MQLGPDIYYWNLSDDLSVRQMHSAAIFMTYSIEQKGFSPVFAERVPTVYPCMTVLRCHS